MKFYLHRITQIACFICAGCFSGNSQITWQKDTALNNSLPAGIEVYRGTGTLNGTNIRAVYTLFDPVANPQLELDLAVGNNVLRTPQQFAALETEKVWVTTNGGFFGGTVSNSHITKDGVVLYPNVKSLARNSTTYFPTRAGFGINATGQPSVHWLYNIGTANTPYTYSTPSPNNILQAPQPVPTATFPSLGTIWDAYTAMGGGPMLLKNGTKMITDTAEMFDAASGVDPSGLAPRTAIGYTASGKYYFLVVDGRATSFPGASANMLADIFLSLGCNNAINLDGGGSSAMIVNDSLANTPSDATGVRPVSSVLFIKQKNWIYDTEFSDTYKEIGGTWSETSNTGFFGPSRARFVTSDVNKKALFLLKNLPPGGYRLSAWWVAAANRSNRTPYIIRRKDTRPDTVFVNQTANGAKWNLLGSYQLSAGDTIEVSGAGQSGAFVTSDAIQLVKYAEPNPVFTLSNGDNGEHVKDSTIQFITTIKSVNSGILFNKLIVKKQLADGSTILLDSLTYLNIDSISYPVNTTAAEAIGQLVKITFTIIDSAGRRFDTLYQYKVTPAAQIRFVPAVSKKDVQKNKVFTLQTELDSRSSTLLLNNFRIYKTVGGGNKILLDSILHINNSFRNYTLTDSITENVREKITYDFELTDTNNDTASRAFYATVVPARGNFRIAVISDLNSGYGEAFYEWQVDSIMQRIPRIWKPDLVVSGGDLIGGQSTTYDSLRVVAMWNAFDDKIAKPLRDNNIPHAFTMGNHDAAAGFNVDRVGAKNYWNTAGKFPGWYPVDTSHYPYYQSFTEKINGDFFFVSWEASDANLSQADIDWTVQQFQRPEALAAKYKILIGHMPFYGVAQERDGPGNILTNGDALRKRVEDLGVKVYISGHHHAYYPGRRGSIDLLNTGAAGSGPRKWTFSDETAPNTVTLIDFFDDRDTLIYTTYEIQKQNADDMSVFNESRMPKAVFGYNGFTHNRNLQVKADATGKPSHYHIAENINSNSGGDVMVVKEGNALKITGSFTGLNGKLLTSADAIGVYKKSFPATGDLLKALKVKSTDGKSGTFEGLVPIDSRKELLELISAGALYVLAKTDSFPNGEWRAQLYQSDNLALSKAVITSQKADSVYLVRNIAAYFKIDWTKSTDKDLDAAIYKYELAQDSLFAQIIFSKSSGTNNALGLTQIDLWQLMDTIAIDVEKKYYHRIISSDGRQITIGDALVLRLKKTNAPPSGNIELQAPAYVYECAQQDGDGNCVAAFSNNASGHGTVVDQFSRVWYHPYSGGVSVKNADGTYYQLTSPNLKFARPSAPGVLLPAWEPGAYLRQVTINATNYTINLVTGIGLASDGNILLASSSALIKLDVVTGEPLRYLQLGSLGLSNPTSDSLGRIFVTRVLNNQSFILKESMIRPTGFDTVLSQFPVDQYPGTTRSSAIGFDGKSLFLPSAGGSFVNRYVSADGINFIFDRRITLQGTCNSIHVKPGNKMYVVSNKSGNTPPILEYRDFSDTTQIKSWSFPLTDIAAEASDLRGLSMNVAGDTFYVTSMGSFKLYKYHIPNAGSGADLPPANAPLYTIEQIKGVNANGISDSTGVYCRLSGTVETTNKLSGNNGYEFILQDATAGVQVFNLQAKMPFVPINKGDSIIARGYIRQAFGLIRMVPDSIIILSNSNALSVAVQIDSLKEAFESEKVKLPPVTIKNDSNWIATGNYLWNEITAYKNNSDSLGLQLEKAADIYLQPAPRGEFSAKGIITQFKEEAPYTSGYSLQVNDSLDITYANAGLNHTDYCVNDSIVITLHKFGLFDPGNQFTFQLSDSTGNFTPPLYQYTLAANETHVKIAAPAAGTKYRARFNSSAPALLGGNNGFNLIIHPQPVMNITRNGNVLTASEALQYQWYLNGNLIPAPAGTNAQITITLPGLYKVVGITGGCSSFSEIVVQSPLPVTILWVNASQQNGQVLINWQTVDELNIQSYIIERSQNSIHFTEAGVVTAKAGNTNLYTWLDAAPFADINFYRIKCIDKDGKSQFSKIVKASTKAGNNVQIFPNPVIGGKLNVQLRNMAAGIYSMEIKDVTGRNIYTTKITHTNNNNYYRLQTPVLSKGNYYLIVTGANYTNTRLFLTK